MRGDALPLGILRVSTGSDAEEPPCEPDQAGCRHRPRRRRGQPDEVRTPKVLHEICGRTLLGHVVAAARELEPADWWWSWATPGAGHGAPGRGRPGARTAVQPEQHGTGHAVRDRAGGAAPPTARAGRHGRDHLRRHPAADRRDAGRAGRRARAGGQRGHRADRAGAGPDRLRADPARRGRLPSRRSSSSEDADPAQRAISEINSGVFAFDAKLLADALAGWHGQRAGRGVPDRHAGDPAAGPGTGSARRWRRTTGTSLGINDRVQLAEARRLLNDRLLRERDARGRRPWWTRRPPGST